MKFDFIKYHPFLCLSAIFSLFVIISVLFGGIFLSSSVYVAVSPTLNGISFREFCEMCVLFCNATIIQLAVICFAAFSNFTFTVCALISVYRGIAMGFAASRFYNGSIVLASDTSVNIFGADFSRYALILIGYLFTSLLLFAVSSVSVKYSRFLVNRTVGESSKILIYFLTFSIGAGAIVLFDLVRTLFI